MRATYHFLFKDEGTWFSRLVIKGLVYMHLIQCVCVWNFGTKLFKGGTNVKPRKNSFFLKMGKMVISVENLEFSRSQMAKRTSPLESSHEM